MARLKQWCEDINATQNGTEYDLVYVDQESFESYRPDSFEALMAGFREYKS